MKKEGITQEQYEKIMDCFIMALMKHGLKSTTMDSIASSLQMSKRTLYEIFGSKEDMFREAIKYFNKKMSAKISDIFKSSGNVMEAIIKCFLYNRDLMSKLNYDFIRDMEEYASQGGLITEEHRRQNSMYLYDVLQKGVNEGYFREDVNLMVQCQIFHIEMQALKHAEDLFNKNITLLEVFDSIIIGFLRSISSYKGLQELDKYLPSYSPNMLNK